MTQDDTTPVRSRTLRRTRPGNGTAGPFFKWAGGKSQLLSEFEHRFPSGLADGRIDRYVEPFMGGGAVFFFVMQRYPIRESIICDANEELVLTYRVVKDHADALIDLLRAYQSRYDRLDESGRSEMFLEVRATLNAGREGFDYSAYHGGWVERAAALIFLNRTCFNGLFRVNSKGLFNVPFGRYRNPSIVNEANLRLASGLLARTTILSGDFLQSLPFIDERTFVYLDPPYRPLNRTSRFTSYSHEGFTDADQVRLADFFRQADHAGGRVMLSNSDPKNEDPDDDFFDTLYQGYWIGRVPAKRMINSDSGKRGAINEILVMNYSPDDL